MIDRVDGAEQITGVLPIERNEHIHVEYPVVMIRPSALLLDLCLAIAAISVVSAVSLPRYSVLLLGVVIGMSALAISYELTHLICGSLRATRPLSKSCAICVASTRRAEQSSSLCKHACKLKAYRKTRRKWFPSGRRRRVKLTP